MNEDKAIDKVRKLLNLANNEGATEGERDNALRMAYALIAKHNLEMSQVDQKEEERVISKEPIYARPWARRVASSVASLFFCQYFTQNLSQRNMALHHFVGKLSNSVTAMEISMFLIASIRRESGKRQRALGESVTWRRSFCTGAAQQIQQRIHELRKTEESKAPSTGTSLVLADVYRMEVEANEAFIKSLGYNLITKNSRSAGVLGDAVRAGRDFGSSLPLNVQVNSSSTKRLS